MDRRGGRPIPQLDGPSPTREGLEQNRRKDAGPADAVVGGKILHLRGTPSTGCAGQGERKTTRVGGVSMVPSEPPRRHSHRGGGTVVAAGGDGDDGAKKRRPSRTTMDAVEVEGPELLALGPPTRPGAARVAPPRNGPILLLQFLHQRVQTDCCCCCGCEHCCPAVGADDGTEPTWLLSREPESVVVVAEEYGVNDDWRLRLPPQPRQAKPPPKDSSDARGLQTTRTLEGHKGRKGGERRVLPANSSPQIKAPPPTGTHLLPGHRCGFCCRGMDVLPAGRREQQLQRRQGG